VPKAELDEAALRSPVRSRDLVELDEALQRLEEIDARKSRIVELRYFAGLSVQETALVMDISERTVLREWTLAKAWLYKEVQRNPEKR
jgi:RNA polymerase sigma factor (sigma-70 family)